MVILFPSRKKLSEYCFLVNYIDKIARGSYVLGLELLKVLTGSYLNNIR